jgi:two-component system phosphate regulon sensor histidine kinase PhoR
MADIDPRANMGAMAQSILLSRGLVEALDEPAIVVEGSIVRLANAPARALFGKAIEGRDVRFALRHPHVLDAVLAGEGRDVDASGIAELGRSWRLAIRPLGSGLTLVRMVDRSAAVSAERMRVDFVANASHELRTPLATILGYAETLADDGAFPNDKVAEFGATMRDEARRMLRIIEDLMSLSRIEADRFVAPNEQVDLAQVVAAAVGNNSHPRERARCRIDVAVEDGLPSFRGDSRQLVQLLDNLIANAIRYGCTKPGAAVEVAASREGGWLKLSVADHGPGIAREHLPRLTERFYRVDAARSREGDGTGLGLAIVKHIVERHRGTLDIASDPGKGTRVTVRLPLA